MKKVLLSVLAVLLVCSQAHAFFNPVDLIMDVAAQELERNLKETPTPAFLGIIQVYNMTCDRPVTENMVKDYWQAFGETLEEAEDALTLFAKVAQSRKADLEPVKVDCLKNIPKYSRNVAFCTGEELREAVEGGAILYVHYDETVAQAISPRGAERSGRFAQSGPEIDPGGAESGGETEEQARAHRKGEGEEEHGDIDAEIREAGHGDQEVRGGGVPDRAHDDSGETRSQGPSREGEHEAFGQDLSRDPGAAGAHRGAHRDLPRAGRGAREEDVREVRAGDEENEADARHQEPHPAAIRVRDVLGERVHARAEALVRVRVRA